MLDRQSIDPTFDSSGIPGAYTVETRVEGRRLTLVPISDPFVSQRVVLGWRDLLRGLLKRRLEVEVLVGGNRERIEDVLELDAEYLGRQGSTRRQAWNEDVNRRLRNVAAVEAERGA